MNSFMVSGILEKFRNQKILKFTKFKEKRYKILIDFNRKFIDSKIIFFGSSENVCKTYEDNLYCSNFLGGTFSINKNTLKFHYSSTWIDKNPTDAIIIVHGRCEVF